MPAIGNLDGTGRAATRAVGINTGTIPSDNFDPGIALQPRRHRASVPIRQEIDDAKIATVALANKTARIAWAAMSRNEVRGARRMTVVRGAGQRPRQDGVGVAE